MNRPVHFEIHAEDPERASKFYSEVFGWNIKKWENPGAEYWVVMTGRGDENSKWPGINGGLLRRRGSAPTEGTPVNSFVCTIDVTNIDEALEKVKNAKGTIAVPKVDMGGVGFLAYVKDTEGNIFGIIQDTSKK